MLGFLNGAQELLFSAFRLWWNFSNLLVDLQICGSSSEGTRLTGFNFPQVNSVSLILRIACKKLTASQGGVTTQHLPWGFPGLQGRAADLLGVEELTAPVRRCDPAPGFMPKHQKVKFSTPTLEQAGMGGGARNQRCLDGGAGKPGVHVSVFRGAKQACEILWVALGTPRSGLLEISCSFCNSSFLLSAMAPSPQNTRRFIHRAMTRGTFFFI